MRHEILDKIISNRNRFKVNLAGLNIKDGEILGIMTYIKKNQPTATKIDLDNNLISDQGAKILSKHLHDFNDVKEISIQFNNIGKLGAIELFRLKNDFSDLDILFQGNNITNMSEMNEIEQLASVQSYKP